MREGSAILVLEEMEHAEASVTAEEDITE